MMQTRSKQSLRFLVGDNLVIAAAAAAVVVRYCLSLDRQAPSQSQPRKDAAGNVLLLTPRRGAGR